MPPNLVEVRDDDPKQSCKAYYFKCVNQDYSDKHSSGVEFLVYDYEIKQDGWTCYQCGKFNSFAELYGIRNASCEQLSQMSKYKVEYINV